MGYPFTAIVGQENMKLSLLLNAINPRIGGVLIQGEKGSAKSTAVRALAAVLPPHEDGTPMQVVTLPLNATEDRLVGTLDVEHMIADGKASFSPGILAKAHENVLYVDEVNLLDDHLVDVLLDAAAMKVNRVERDGISHSHPSSFILVGTMNPEEGPLRPQLLDRFGLAVTVKGEEDVISRVAVLERRFAYENDPLTFMQAYEQAEKDLAKKLKEAREQLGKVAIPEGILRSIAELSIHFHMEGHRGDLTLLEASRALAAFEGKGEIVLDHVKRMAPLVFSHRMKQKMSPEQFTKAMDEALDEEYP